MEAANLNSYHEEIESIGDLVLNLNYWDCNCLDGYIHPVTEAMCVVCGSALEEHPNSIESEVSKLFGRNFSTIN